MGHALTAFREGIETTVDNPVYVGVAGAAFVVATVVSIVLNVTLGLIPIVGQLLASLLNSVVVGPLVATGVLGMAYASSVGKVTPGAFVEAIQRRGKRVMGAYALLFATGVAVTLVGTVGVAVVVFTVGFSGSMMGAGMGPGAGLADALLGGAGLALLGLALLVALAVALVGMVLQFVGVAIVVGDESATSSFGASWRVFRNNVGSVVGYTLLRAIPSVAVVVVAGALFYAGTQVGDTIVAAALGGVAFLMLGVVNFAFLNAYHVAYYQRVSA